MLLASSRNGTTAGEAIVNAGLGRATPRLYESRVTFPNKGGRVLRSPFMSFRRMISPVVVQLVFVLGVVASLAVGVLLIGRGLTDNNRTDALIGYGTLILGPFVVRLYCEAIVVFFRINETLTDLYELLYNFIAEQADEGNAAASSGEGA
jgi:hypothetical protein